MKIFFKAVFFLILIVLSIALLFIGNGYNMYKDAIESTSLEEKVEQIQNKENYAKFSELPQMYINAVISVEDKRFYKHNGIDIFAICRAAINDIKAMEFIEGGSTITQQLAKNMYFTCWNSKCTICICTYQKSRTCKGKAKKGYRKNDS